MPIFRFSKHLCLAAAGLAISAHALAAWKFDPQQSNFSATFTDQRTTGNVEHTYHLQNLTGTIDDQGNLNIPLKLSQLDLMNQLPEWLQTMAGDQSAQISGKINPSWFNLGKGQSITKTVALTFVSHKHSHTQNVALKMERLDDGSYHVVTAQPLALRTSELMKESYAPMILTALGYQKVGDTVPINFDANVVQS